MKIINIEGNDGTGKRTVANHLKDKLTTDGFKVEILDFPNYESPTGKLVKEFLMGELYQKNPVMVDPYHAALPYTLDRIVSYAKHPQYFDGTYDILIFNRSYLSNFFYQFSKYFMNNSPYKTSDLNIIKTWLMEQICLEIFNTPLETISIDDICNVYLHVSDISQNQQKMKNRGETLDLHETNVEYLEYVEKFAIMMEAVPLTIDNLMDYYRYTIINYTNGHTSEEIRSILDQVINNIILIGNLSN